MTALSASPKPTEAVALLSALVKLMLALMEVDRKAEAFAEFASVVADVWAGAKEAEPAAIQASAPVENSAGTNALSKAASASIAPQLSLVAALRLFGITRFEISPEMLLALLKREGKNELLREIALLDPGEKLSLSALVRRNKPNVLDNSTLTVSSGRHFVMSLPNASQLVEIDIDSRKLFTLSDLYWGPAPEVKLTCEVEVIDDDQPFLPYGIRLTSLLPATVHVVRLTLTATNGLDHSQLLIWDSP